MQITTSAMFGPLIFGHQNLGRDRGRQQGHELTVHRQRFAVFKAIASIGIRALQRDDLPAGGRKEATR